LAKNARFCFGFAFMKTDSEQQLKAERARIGHLNRNKENKKVSR
jgi:hypothetical protein